VKAEALPRCGNIKENRRDTRRTRAEAPYRKYVASAGLTLRLVSREVSVLHDAAGLTIASLDCLPRKARVDLHRNPLSGVFCIRAYSRAIIPGGRMSG
jgi:hypothetical protein